jgi:hypothetical protein
VHPPKVEEHEKREKRSANFPVGMGALSDDRRAGRPRGLGADVVYAVRASTPAAAPSVEIMLPYEGSGGPR